MFSKVNISSPSKLFFLLTKGDFSPNPHWHQLSYRVKFAIRILLPPFESTRWLKDMVEFEHLDEMLQAQPSLPCKLHRPYLSSILSKKQARQMLIEHYQFMYSCLPSEFRHKCLAGKPYQIAKITGKDEQQLLIILMTFDRFNREGELTLCVRNQDGVDLARITFSIVKYNGIYGLFIGGLQGSNHEVDHNLIQRATKTAYGIFPKRLALDSIRFLAEHLGITQIAAVSDDSHIYRHWRYRKKLKKMHASYDEFWQSVGGEKNGDGIYLIPVVHKVKSLESIASKKRAEYRRRYNILDELSNGINEGVFNISE